jgi:dTDP-4-amino-4,6-dideoxy-D-galactose acyltransferase
MTNLPVEYLEWDSTFFNKRIARLTTHCLTEEDVKKIFLWAREEKIDCLYYLADGKEMNSTGAAEKNGFHFVDLRVTMIKDLKKPEKPFIPNWHIRRAVEDDLDLLKTTSKNVFHLSRFRADEHFDQVKADKMYEVWIENDLRLKGHDVWVIDVEGHLASFTSVAINPDGRAQLGLAGTQKEWRGKGLSLEIQRFIGEELRNRGVEELEVVTQGRNIPAQNLFQRSGYYMRSIDLWYHKWFD